MLNITLRGKEFHPVQLVSFICSTAVLAGMLFWLGALAFHGVASNISDPGYGGGPTSIIVGPMFVIIIFPVIAIHALMTYGIWVNSKKWALGWIFYGAIFMTVFISEIMNYFNPKGASPSESILVPISYFAIICAAYIWNYIYARKVNRALY